MNAHTLKKIRTVGDVTEYQLSNGLRVLYKRETAAPVVAVCITFHVGSRNEAAGHTGSTHILEHLLFKDSKKFNQKNGKAITDYLEWFGANINATTWLDRTNYFELLPRERLAEALALEADRMRGSLFNEADLKSEMTVVRNEYERSRNDPFELLDEAVTAAVYTTHPYRIPTIGTKEDIEHSTAAKLREFYDTYYWPNNATLAIMGDVSRIEIETLVLKEFGPIPHSPHEIPTMTVVEPQQTKARSVSLVKPMGVSIGILAYKVPEATHKDLPALQVLAVILGGGFGSRLQKALVDKGLAADVAARVLALHDPGTMECIAHCANRVKPQRVINVMREEIAACAKKAPTRTEIAHAQERIFAEIAKERDGVFIEVLVVSEAIAAGDWTLAYRLEDLIKKVTPSDIVRVAKTYLSPKQETSGVLLEASS